MNYKYERYNWYTYYWEVGNSLNPVDEGAGTSVSGYESFEFSSSYGYYPTGSYVTKTVQNNVVFSSGGSGLKLNWVSNGRIIGAWMYASGGQYRGSYIDTVIATDGTYPTDGVSGSYWYVRTTPILTQVRVNGAWKNASTMKIKVNNAWKDIAAMKVKFAGAWKTIF